MLPAFVFLSALLVSLTCTLNFLFSIVVRVLLLVTFFIMFAKDACGSARQIKVIIVMVTSIITNTTNSKRCCLSYIPEARAICELNHQRLCYYED
jgi:hypothetical protein